MNTTLPGIADLHDLNEGFIRAVQASDAGWFDAHLARDFLNTNPDGTLSDRSEFLERVARPAGIRGLAVSDVRIRRFGDVAVIHGRTSYTRADGAAGSGRYTDVWARQDGRWLCVCAHVTRG